MREACVVSVEEKLAVLVTKLPNSNLTEAILEIAVLDKFKTVQFKSGLYIVDKIPRTNSVSCKIQRDDAKVLVLELMKQKT